jgi:hypothetical protein
MSRRVRRPLRTKRLLVSFAADELVVVRARAAAAHIPLARYIREVALGYAPKPKRHAVNADAIRVLASLGKPLRDIAARAEVAGMPALERSAREAVDRILATIGGMK